MSDLEDTYSPTAAATYIDFAPSLLRRYAAAFEAQGGSIPRDNRGGRIYTQALLEHFRAARERVRSGELLDDALRTVDLAPTNAVPDDETQVSAKDVLSLLERLAGAQTAILERLERLEQPRAVPEQGEVFKRLAETERMNSYLLAELERRRLETEAQPTRRRWWQLWRRG